MENKLEILNVKHEVSLVTMAMGKLDDNIASTISTLKEVLHEVGDIKASVAIVEDLKKRVENLEEELKDVPTKQEVQTLQQAIEDIKAIPNKLLMRFFLGISGALAVAIVAWFLNTGG